MAGEKDATVLIIGAGVAGLTAAIALDQRGVDSLVFEQVPDISKSQYGAGLGLGFNATRAFRHLGLLDELREVAVPITKRQFLTKRGMSLGTSPRAPAGELQLGVLRPSFHQFLLDRVGADRLVPGRKLVRFDQDDRGVTAEFADGSTARGDVLVGADGLRSTVRAQLLGPAEPRYAGYVARRGVVETDAARESAERVFLGPAQRFWCYPVGRWYLYWGAATNEPPGGKQTGAEIKQTVLREFKGWARQVVSLVEATDDANAFLADTYDRDPADRWGEGRVTLLGDAAHPMTWDRGQGAGQGIEGAVLLAKELAHGGEPAAALRAWEAQRIPRTAKVVQASRAGGQRAQTNNPVKRTLNTVGSAVISMRFRAGKGGEELKVEY